MPTATVESSGCGVLLESSRVEWGSREASADTFDRHYILNVKT